MLIVACIDECDTLFLSTARWIYKRIFFGPLLHQIGSMQVKVNHSQWRAKSIEICQSVGQSVGQPVGRSVGPCHFRY